MTTFAQKKAVKALIISPITPILVTLIKKYGSIVHENQARKKLLLLQK